MNGLEKIDIFQYTDYRKYLQDLYLAKKKDRAMFSHRFIAQKVGFQSSGFFSKILLGKRNISGEMIKRFTAFLKLGKKEAGYFEAMVYYNQAATIEDKKRWFTELTGFKDSVLRKVDPSSFEYFDKWYHTAIRELLHFRPFTGDYGQLAKSLVPSISPAEAKRSLELLERLGYILKNAQGQFVRSDTFSYSTGMAERNFLLDQYQIGTLELAKEALNTLPRGERNLSTLTFSYSKSMFPKLEEEVRAFRKRLLEMAEANKTDDTVYQFNFQLYPLTKTWKAGER
jgi:uncharacterized protein (TIGR02147 family)